MQTIINIPFVILLTIILSIIPYAYSDNDVPYRFNVVAFINSNVTAVGLRVGDNIIKLNKTNYPIWYGEYSVDLDTKYHYILYDTIDDTLVEEENFDRTVKYSLPDNGSNELVNEFYGKENTVYQHPRLPRIYNITQDFMSNKYSELFDDRFISVIHFEGNSTIYEKMKHFYSKNQKDKDKELPSLKVNATITTPFISRSYQNLLLELNTLVEKINVETDSQDYKSSYFLSYINESNSLVPEDVGIFNKTSIQLLSTSTDSILLRHILYAEMGNSIAVPTAQVSYARVYFNNEPVGFFLLKENLNTDYFVSNFDSPTMYGQLGENSAPMTYVGEVLSKSLSQEEMNKEDTDPYYNYWYQGKKIAEQSRDKSELADLFKIFQDSTLDEVQSIFNGKDFLKNMALDYVTNNHNAYLYNATNYFLYFNEKTNLWNYHDGYFNSPFTVEKEDDSIVQYEKFRSNIEEERPPFDYLINYPNERNEFESHIESILYRIFNYEILSQRIDSIFDMIYDDLKWDITYEQNLYKRNFLFKRNSINVVKTLKLKEDLTKLKNWIKQRNDIITKYFKFIPERSYDCPLGVVDNLLTKNNMKYNQKEVVNNACIAVKIPFNVYSLFTHCFLISLIILFLHLVYGVFINPIVWHFSNKKRRVLPSVFIKLWCMAVVLLAIMVVSVYFWIRNKPRDKLYYSMLSQVYYKMLDYGTGSAFMVTLSIVMWLVINRENFIVLFCFLWVKWPRFNRRLLRSSQPQNLNYLEDSTVFTDSEEYQRETDQSSSITVTEEDVSNVTVEPSTTDSDESVVGNDDKVCYDTNQYVQTNDYVQRSTSMKEFEDQMKRRYYCESLNSVDLFKSENQPSYTYNQYKIIKMYKNIRHGFLIVCHNSSDVLPKTLEHLLNVTTPMCIFIAENGSTEEEKIKMKEIIDKYSMQFRRTHPDYRGLDIIYANLNEGSKTLAQFCLLNNLHWFGIDIEYVTIIDDDVLIPPEWIEEEILTYFDDPKVKALAYPIATANRRERVAPAFQNFEYHLSMYSKKFHRDVGSVLFTSGAIGTWNVPILLECLYRHDTEFRGEDLQLGLRLHTLYGKSRFCDPNHYHEGNYKIEMSHVIVETLVPGCYMHIHDIFNTLKLPKWFVNWFKRCDCGEYSLARQRIVFWEPARHRFLFKFLDCIFHKCKWNHRATITAKIFCADILLSVFNDYYCLFFLVFMFIKSSYLQVLMVLCISFAIAYISYDAFNLFVAAGLPHIKLPYEVCITFPICYQFFSTFLYRICSIIYNFTYYLPFIRAKPKIKERALKNDLEAMAMPSIISEEGTEGAIANVLEIANFLKEGKKAKRRRRKDTKHKILKHSHSHSHSHNAHHRPLSGYGYAPQTIQEEEEEEDVTVNIGSFNASNTDFSVKNNNNGSIIFDEINVNKEMTQINTENTNYDYYNDKIIPNISILNDDSTHQEVSSIEINDDSTHRELSSLEINDDSTHRELSSLEMNNDSTHRELSSLEMNNDSTHREDSSFITINGSNSTNKNINENNNLQPHDNIIIKPRNDSLIKLNSNMVKNVDQHSFMDLLPTSSSQPELINQSFISSSNLDQDQFDKTFNCKDEIIYNNENILPISLMNINPDIPENSSKNGGKRRSKILELLRRKDKGKKPTK